MLLFPLLNWLLIIPDSAPRLDYQLPDLGEPKKEYGNTMILSAENTHPAPDLISETTWTTQKNTQHIVKLNTWNDLLLRGSRVFRSSQYPINLTCVRVTDHQGRPVFKRPMWLAVFGEMRHHSSPIEVYQNYAARYDIEHFFRFGKNRLLMSAYQTPDVEHEEHWWKLSLLAFHQLYLARALVPIVPEPWERYLPEFKTPDEQQRSIASPSKTQRGFSSVLDTIGSPAAQCIARGKPRGRILGETQPEKPDCPIIFKSRPPAAKIENAILSGFEQTARFSIPQKIDDLLALVQASLNKLKILPKNFAEMLLDSS